MSTYIYYSYDKENIILATYVENIGMISRDDGKFEGDTV